MKHRYKKLEIAIDSLPTGLDNGSIMTSAGVKNITASLIGGNYFGFRRRKNFSLILLAGLSALLCALYYTSYYPGMVWTLRLGVTSFNTTVNGQEKRDPSKALVVVAASVDNIRNSHDGHNNNLEAAAAAAARSPPAEIFPSIPDESSRDSGIHAGEGDIKNSIRNNHHETLYLSANSGGSVSGSSSRSSSGSFNNHNNIARQIKETVEGGENPDEISTPKTWNWKYWASLGYWQLNLTDDASDDYTIRDNVDLGKSHSENAPDIVTGGGDGETDVALISDSSSSAAATTRNPIADTSISARTSVKVTDFHRYGRLACNFPRLKPFDPSITEFIKSPPFIDCTKDYPLVFRTNFRNKLILWRHPFLSETQLFGEGSKNGRSVDSVSRNYSCCYKTITRGNGSDHNVVYSKRCYPIVKVETEIPAEHEFISVRCRIIVIHHRTNQQQQREHPKESEGPPESHKKTHKDDNNGSNNSSNNNNDNTSTTTKVYKDMMAFVPLKPLVEDRIRKYEESKRKFIYASKKVKSNKRIKLHSPENTGELQDSVHEEEEKLEQAGINLSEGDRERYQNNSEDTSQKTYKKKVSDVEEGGKGESGEGEKEGEEEEASSTLSNEDKLSVVILGLDAQSHMNFIRQMPQTYNFLTKNLSAIGMYGYTKVGDNTFPNVVTLLSGLSVEELEKECWPTKQSYFDSCPWIWKKFAASGYRTSLAEDSVWMGTFNYEKKGFLHAPTDYYLHPMSLLMAKKIGHETWANAKLCYGPRLAFEVLLDYIVKTAVTFRNSLYFQFVWANSLFHDYLNNPRLGDELLMMTLEFMKKNGFLKNTAFILLSDHGIRWGSIRSTYQGKIEERMPLAYFTFPSWFRQKYPRAIRNLKKNMFRLTTPFDVYETLRDILRISQRKHIKFDRWCDDDVCSGGGGGDSKGDFEEKSKSNSAKKGGSDYPRKNDERPPRSISLFRPIPLHRTCKMAGIEEHWCVCHKMEKVPINSSLVESGAQFVLDIINGLVRKHSGFCAKLSLLKINEAKRKIDGDIDRGLDVDFFLTRETGTTPSIGTSPSWRSSSGDNDPVSGTNGIFENGNSGNSKNDNDDAREKSKVGSESTPDTPPETVQAGQIKDTSIGTAPNFVSPAGSEQSEKYDMMRTLSTSSDIKKMIQLQITLVTEPGGAVFEATIYGEVDPGIISDSDEDMNPGHQNKRQINHHWKLSGDISRLNLYGSQSACISDYKVQKYCYCQSLDAD